MHNRVVGMDVKLVAAIAREDLNVRAFCREQSISPSTFYKWQARFREGGLEALVEQSRRPTRSPGLVCAAVEDAIVTLRKELLESCMRLAGAHVGDDGAAVGSRERATANTP